MLHLSLEKQRGSAHPRCAVALRRPDPQGIDNLQSGAGRGIMRHARPLKIWGRADEDRRKLNRVCHRDVIFIN